MDSAPTSPQSPGPKPLELRYEPGGASLRLVLCLGIAAFALIALLNIEQQQSGSAVIAGLFLLVGGYGAFEHWRRMKDHDAVLTISRDGILDRRLSRHMIRWEQIIAIEAKDTSWWANGGDRRQPYLDLFVHKAAPVKPGLVAWLWSLAGARGFVVTAEGLDGSFNEILLAAKHFADSRGVVMKV